MNRKIFLIILFVALLAADQLSKLAVQANMELYQSIQVIPGFFSITYVLNPGAAFGIFRDHPEIFRRLFFIGVTSIAIIFFVVLLVKEYNNKLRSIAYVMVIAGALGNMIDRVRLGMVVDFLDFYFRGWHWYTFNIADCCVTIGIGLLLVDIIFFDKLRLTSSA